MQYKALSSTIFKKVFYISAVIDVERILAKKFSSASKKVNMQYISVS